MDELSHPHMTIGKTIVLTIETFVNKVMSLLFNMLSSYVTVFLPRNKCLFISWEQSPSAVILELRKIKSITISNISPSIFHEVMEPDEMILIFWKMSFMPAFSLSSFTLIKRLFHFLFTFWHWSGIICISEVIVILLAILIPAWDSSSPAFPLDVFCIKVK